MSKGYQEVWDECLRMIREEIPDQSFNTWFKPIKAIHLEESVLTIQVPNRFFYEYIEEHFVNVLKRSVRAILGPEARLEYQILLTKKREQPRGMRTDPGESLVPGTYNPEKIPNPFVIPGIKRMKVETNLNDRYTFDTFIEGDCNRLARSAARAISGKPGGTAFNPLVIYGDVGLGKTHLAQAIGNGVVDKYPVKNVVYVTSEKFTNQIIQSIKNTATNELVNYYQLLDVLIVDDIQFLKGRVKTQEIFFHIFNQLHQTGKQIVLTSDRAPKDLDGMEERLISRFKWGLTADLQTPEFETRMAILESKLAEEGLTLPPETREYICYNIKDNIRELEGVVISLIAQSSLNEREIDLRLVQEVLQQFVQRGKQEITIDRIKETVSEYYEIGVDKLESKFRKREIVLARQLAMYLSKDLTRQPLKVIGNAFGGRDHTTVIYSCRAIENLMDTDIYFREVVLELQKRVRMSIV